MKIEEKIQVPASERVAFHYVCDKCNKPCRGDEPTVNYEVAGVEIHVDSGESYPDGACVDRIEFDCCSACFTEHVIPALEALGFKPREEDRGW